MDAISIEEANKIRVAMGMKPLPVPGAQVISDPNNSGDSEEDPASTLETRHAAASDNWRKLQEDQDKKAKREAQKEAIRKAREEAARVAKLEGIGLGEEDNKGDL